MSPGGDQVNVGSYCNTRARTAKREGGKQEGGGMNSPYALMEVPMGRAAGGIGFVRCLGSQVLQEGD